MSTHFDSLIDLIGAAGPDGRLTVHEDWPGIIEELKLLNAKARLSAVVQGVFDNKFGLFSMPFDHLKNWASQIHSVCEVDISPNNAQYTASFCLARALLLPGDNPAKELSELREFLLQMKPFFEDCAALSVSVKPDIMLYNEREKSATTGALVTTGELSARVFVHGEHQRSQDPAIQNIEKWHTTRLEAIVAGNSELQAFMRNMALALNKMGTWSWFNIRESMIFGTNEGPCEERLLTALREERKRKTSPA